MSEMVPEGWEGKKLGSLSTFIMGQAPLGTDCNKEQIGTPFVKAGEFRQKKPIVREWTTSPLKFAKENDVLICVVGATCGKLNLGIDCAIGRSVAAIRPSESLNYLFLYNYLQTQISTMRNDSSGSAQGVITTKDLEEIPLPFPPLPEQKKIASILTSVDEVIETTQKQIDKLQDLKKATMNELLTKGIGHTEFKDSELGRIPKSWEVARLGNYSIIKGGKRLPKGSEFSENPTLFPYIRVSDLKNGSVDTNNLRFVSEKVREHIKRYTISEKDLYISIAGSIGIVGTIPSKLDGALLTENAAKIVIKSEAIHYSFLYYLMNSPMVQRQFHQETGTGGGVPKLALFRIEETTFSLPKISEQHRIVNVLQSLDRKLDTLVQKLSQTQSLKKSLMQDLLTGKVRVRVN